tara:strand:- start:23560 stop:25338 length:1779 start_codon:yes stop_codon:yes gene_type:complete
MSKFVLILKFFFVELKLIKKRSIDVINTIISISFLKYLKHIIYKNQSSVFKDKDLNKYLELNNSIWKFKKNKNVKYILVDLTLSTHPMHAIIQCILGNNFRKLTGYDCKAIINENDILTKFIARSFSINNFEILRNGNIFKRFYYYYKSLNLINNEKCLKKLVGFKSEKIEIGKSAYEFAVRNYIKELPSKDNIHLFYLALSKSLSVLHQSRRIFNSRNIAFLLMAEIQFIPNRIFFQKSLLNKIPIYVSYGAKKEDQISICCFDSLKSFNQHRMKFSKKLLNFLIKNFSADLKNYISNFIKEDTKINKIGFGEKIYSNKLPKKRLLKFNNYKDFCNKFKFSNKSKTVMILPNVFVDNLLTHDWALFQNPIEWFLETLKIIKKIKNVNWLIKPHPSEKIYNSNITARKLFSMIIDKENNIKFLDQKYNIDRISDYVSSVISFGGSAGYEYTKLGIPVVTAGDTRYSNFGLTQSPRNLKEYKFTLNNLNKIQKVSSEKKFKAGLYWLLIKDLTRLQNTMIPIALTRSNFYDDTFWKIALKTLKKNKKSKINTEFYKNLATMYKYKNRHSLKLNKLLKFKKRISFNFNDTNSNR